MHFTEFGCHFSDVWRRLALGLTTSKGAQDLEITQGVAPSNQLIRAAPGVTGGWGIQWMTNALWPSGKATKKKQKPLKIRTNHTFSWVNWVTNIKWPCSLCQSDSLPEATPEKHRRIPWNIHLRPSPRHPFATFFDAGHICQMLQMR